jgi:Arc/MetJ family transcription regulator
MKITMNIDGPLLGRVMKLAGAKTKTAAVDYALREVERREVRMKLLREGMDMEKRLEGPVFQPGYDVMAARIADKEARYGADR